MKLARMLALCFVALIALLLVANEFMAWRVKAQLNGRIAAIRAAGDPGSIEDLAPQVIDDTENAAVVLDAMAPRLDQFSKEYGEFFKTPIGKGLEGRKNHGLPATPAQLAAVKTILDKYPDIDAGLAVVAACSNYASIADYSAGPQKLTSDQLNQMNRVRTTARFLAWRMETLVVEGKQEDAVKLGIECLRIARLWDNEPLVLNALVGIAIRNIAVESLYDALAAGKISAATHAALEKELALGDDPQRLVRVLKTERAYSLSMMDEMGGGPAKAGNVNRVLYRMFGWTMQRHFVGVMDFYDEQLPLAAQRLASATDATKFGPIAGTLVPTLQSTFQANARDQARLRSLRIFNAATKFREDNGHEVSGLGDLSLPKDATIDPFSGQSLKMKATKEGWIIYSVMQNRVDDGGDFKGLRDAGVAPPLHRSTDDSKEQEEQRAEAGAGGDQP